MAGLENIELPSPIQIMSVRASSLVNYGGKQEKLFRLRSGLSGNIAEISGFLRTKYGTMPVGRVIKNDSSTLLPDDRYVFVDP